MAVDPKLRELLDSLDEAPARSRPADDREMLLTVLDRLKIRQARRTRPRAMPRAHEDPNLKSDLEAARSEAQRRQEELDRIVAERQQSQEALQAAHAERDALIRRQEELEARLAQLEASSHGGHLSFVEDDEPEDVEAPSPVVEFSRVDLSTLGGEDELMEFESVGTRQTSAFDEPAAPAWGDEAAWEDEGVSWDEDDDWSQPATGDEWSAAPAEPDWSDDTATSWEQSHDDPDPYRQAPADSAQEHAWAEAEPATDPSWEQAHDDPAPWTEDTTSAPQEPQWEQAAATPAADDQLDERTQRDLNELERQLRDLEDELAKRQAVTGKKTDDQKR